MKLLSLFLSTILILATQEVISESTLTLMESPNTSTTLRFGDKYASAFYTVDGDHFNVVLAFSTGLGDQSQLIRQVFQLIDGQSYRVSIGGYGVNQQAMTIKMKREKSQIRAEVRSCASRDKMAECI